MSSGLPYFNRELSWLAFNERVLAQAQDESTPLLERVKFLSIFSSNLDEFYMVRVAGLRRKVVKGSSQYSPDRLSPAEQISAIRSRVAMLLVTRRDLWQASLLPALGREGIELVPMCALSEEEREQVAAFFESQVFPVLTPLVVGPAHPFPWISNLSLSLAVDVRDPETGVEHFARVKVPGILPRWVATGSGRRFVALEAVIGAHLEYLFAEMEILRWFTFRVTRYSDLDLGQLEEPEDLLETIEERVFQRRFGEVVRLEVQRDMPMEMRQLLVDELSSGENTELAVHVSDDVQAVDDLLAMGDLMQLAALDIPDLKDAPHVPLIPPAFHEGQNVFDVIRSRDVLVHHPYESFAGSVEAFLDAAASDPSVLAIKATLYRTSGDGSLERALTQAAEAGKQVALLIELQARFDEASNINFARNMESYGIHVAYGQPGLKTHAKTVLVVRRDSDGIRRYLHLGTGNYNSRTARVYTDVGLFTCNPLLAADLSDLFNSLTGISHRRHYRRLAVAPSSLRRRTLELIEREAAHAAAGCKAHIIAKMNALVDSEVIEALYRASQAGVDIDLIVRGICCLVPGLEGVSERIRVVSIVGRFLEHSRILYFANAESPEYYISSADWMPRNFDRRVEVMVPVEDRALHAQVRRVLEVCLSDNCEAWDLGSDGGYLRRSPVRESDTGEGPQAGHDTVRSAARDATRDATCHAAQSLLIHHPWGKADI